MNSPLIKISRQVYSFLLRLYPLSYRQEFGEEMEYVFSELLTDSYRGGGSYGVLRLWGRTIVDAAKSITTQYLENQKEGDIMKSKNTEIIMQNKVFAWIASVTLLILMVPLVAMQFSANVVWTLSDFIILGVLLFGTGSTFVLIARKVQRPTDRVVLGVILLFSLLWVWAELAVGIFTNWGS